MYIAFEIGNSDVVSDCARRRNAAKFKIAVLPNHVVAVVANRSDNPFIIYVIEITEAALDTVMPRGPTRCDRC